MIGLAFLAVACLWLWLANLIGIQIAKRLGLKNVYGLLMQLLTIAVMAVAPFIDHIVGMRQFERLCAEETAFQVTPNASNTKRAIRTYSAAKTLDEPYFIAIRRRVSKIVDLDTGEQVAQYKSFGTYGGRIFGRTMLGGEYTCGVLDRGHVDETRYHAFKAQTNLIDGGQTK